MVQSPLFRWEQVLCFIWKPNPSRLARIGPILGLEQEGNTEMIAMEDEDNTLRMTQEVSNKVCKQHNIWVEAWVQQCRNETGHWSELVLVLINAAWWVTMTCMCGWLILRWIGCDWLGWRTGWSVTRLHRTVHLEQIFLIWICTIYNIQ